MDRWMDAFCGGLDELIDGWMFATSLIHATPDSTNHHSACVILFFLLFFYILYPPILGKHSTYYPLIFFKMTQYFAQVCILGRQTMLILGVFVFFAQKIIF